MQDGSTQHVLPAKNSSASPPGTDLAYSTVVRLGGHLKVTACLIYNAVNTAPRLSDWNYPHCSIEIWPIYACVTRAIPRATKTHTMDNNHTPGTV